MLGLRFVFGNRTEELNLKVSQKRDVLELGLKEKRWVVLGRNGGRFFGSPLRRKTVYV